MANVTGERDQAQRHLMLARRAMIAAQRLWQPITQRERYAKIILNHAIDDVIYAANLLKGEAFPP